MYLVILFMLLIILCLEGCKLSLLPAVSTPQPPRGEIRKGDFLEDSVTRNLQCYKVIRMDFYFASHWFVINEEVIIY